jgi:hypothetical protein
VKNTFFVVSYFRVFVAKQDWISLYGSYLERVIAVTHWILRFPADKIKIDYWASRYPSEYDKAAVGISSRVHKCGYYSHKDFLDLCKWKTPRSQSRCRRNSREEVEEVTRIALTTPVERVRIAVLQCLHGIGLPTASVLLHFGHTESYPILDVRALWSLGFADSELPSSYTFDFWWRYVQTCRDIAVATGVDMRILDRALWQFSKENEGQLT